MESLIEIPYSMPFTSIKEFATVHEHPPKRRVIGRLFLDTTINAVTLLNNVKVTLDLCVI